LYHSHQKLVKGEWTMADTAKYFGTSLALVSENIKLGENINKVETCKSRKLALAKLKELKGE
jgi:hypothetical protein